MTHPFSIDLPSATPQHTPSFGVRVALRPAIAFMALTGGFLLLQFRNADGADQQMPAARIRIDPGHPWRPPFGLDRIGRPLNVVVEVVADPKLSEYTLVGYLKGKEIARSPLSIAQDAAAGMPRRLRSLANGSRVGG